MILSAVRVKSFFFYHPTWGISVVHIKRESPLTDKSPQVYRHCAGNQISRRLEYCLPTRVQLFSAPEQSQSASQRFSACWVILMFSIIRPALTWTTGSLTCVCDLFCIRVHTGTWVYSLIRRTLNSLH